MVKYKAMYIRVNLENWATHMSNNFSLGIINSIMLPPFSFSLVRAVYHHLSWISKHTHLFNLGRLISLFSQRNLLRVVYVLVTLCCGLNCHHNAHLALQLSRSNGIKISLFSRTSLVLLSFNLLNKILKNICQ
jgi:hypothetical protein